MRITHQYRTKVEKKRDDGNKTRQILKKKTAIRIEYRKKTIKQHIGNIGVELCV